MATRARWRGKTAARGYGAAHQAERERRLAGYRPGDPCAHCGLAITWPLPLTAVARSHIDLPHTADRGGYLPGLAHATCNRSDGGRRSRTRDQELWITSRQW